MDINEALSRYHPERMKEGWNTLSDGEEIFFISTPSAGLWTSLRGQDPSSVPLP